MKVRSAGAATRGVAAAGCSERCHARLRAGLADLAAPAWAAEALRNRSRKLKALGWENAAHMVDRSQRFRKSFM